MSFYFLPLADTARGEPASRHLFAADGVLHTVQGLVQVLQRVRVLVGWIAPRSVESSVARFQTSHGLSTFACFPLRAFLWLRFFHPTTEFCPN
jgi:hypothetical protein